MQQHYSHWHYEDHPHFSWDFALQHYEVLWLYSQVFMIKIRGISLSKLGQFLCLTLYPGGT